MTKIKIEKGEYECPKCKKFTVIGRSKKADEPLMCCDTEMVKKEKTKFTEHPEPKAKAASASKKKKTKRATTTKRKRKKAEEQVPEFPLMPGEYRCPTCGSIRELQPSDNRDKPMRCDACFVKMLRVG